jgi:hypothetical protein
MSTRLNPYGEDATTSYGDSPWLRTGQQNIPLPIGLNRPMWWIGEIPALESREIR